MAVLVAGLALSGSVSAESGGASFSVEEQDGIVRIATDHYTIHVELDGFRYSFPRHGFAAVNVEPKKKIVRVLPDENAQGAGARPGGTV